VNIIEIENRLVADRAEYAGPGADQTIRDREYLLGLVKAQDAKLTAVGNMVDRAEMHGNYTLFVHEVSEAVGL
jgi:hypothetical protein